MTAMDGEKTPDGDTEAQNTGDRLADGLRAGVVDTPLGPMMAVVDAGGALVRLDFCTGGDVPRKRDGPVFWRGLEARWDVDAVRPVAAQLDAYFAGRRRDFDLPLAPRGGAFFQRVWRALRAVPYGRTLTYGAFAAGLTPPTAARAMGRANALNPISVIIPCHRIVGADGRLTGYAGGLERKAALLRHEGAL